MGKWIAGFLLVLVGVSDVYADQIQLKNGDKIQGKVEKVESGVLTFSTGYSDPMKIKTSEIVQISTDSPSEIHLEGGEVLRGNLSAAGEGEVKVESSSGRQASVVEWGQVQSINPPPNKWHGDISLGASKITGNTDRVAGSAAVEVERKFDTDRFGIRVRFNYAEEDEKVTERNTYGAIKFDHFFTKKLYGYLSVELLNDEFKDLSLRTTVGPGLGYQVWDEDRILLGLEAGISYFIQDHEIAEDDQYATGRGAINFRYKITETILFDDRFIVYPSFESFGDYTLRNEASLSTEIGSGWKLRFSNILENDNNPPAGIEETDVKWILALGYAF